MINPLFNHESFIRILKNKGLIISNNNDERLTQNFS